MILFGGVGDDFMCKIVSYRRGLAICLLVGVVAITGMASASEAVIGVRGKEAVLYSDAALSDAQGSISRRDGRALRKQPAPVIETRNSALLIEYQGQRYWIDSNQVSLAQDNSDVSCGTQIGSTSVGASRGLGGKC